MSHIVGETTGVGKAVVALPALDSLSSRIQGELITPDSPQYDEARSIWNAMIDRRPALIVQCLSTEDIRQTVNYARENGLLLAIRGGGHNIAGNSSCDEGVVLDLSRMKSVQVDPAARIAVVQPGATLGDVDQATQQHGLATPAGVNSTTGIAGLTLGGGFGWLSRKYGMTIDNLLSAEVVLADGSVVTASETENSDLFWGIRGGGGNFGVVSSFTYRLYPVGPEVMSGLIVHPFSEARNLLRYYREFSATLPDEVSVWVVCRLAPPLPFIPEQWHGKPVLVFACFCAGDMNEGAEALQPLRAYGDPIADVIGPHQYVQWQAAFDPLLTPGARNYWKTVDLYQLSDGVIDQMIEMMGRIPGPECEAFIAQMGGAVSRVSPTATAYSDRNTSYILNVHGRWREEKDDGACVEWSRSFYKAMSPFGSTGAYVNFLTADETDRVKEAYGENFERLLALKRKVDPTNQFCMNQNIKP